MRFTLTLRTGPRVKCAQTVFHSSTSTTLIPANKGSAQSRHGNYKPPTSSLQRTSQLITQKVSKNMSTKLDYFHGHMLTLQSKATLLSSSRGEDGRLALILDSTVFHPQGGGQPADTGRIAASASPDLKFVVQDVRSKDGVVYHYGHVEDSDDDGKFESVFEKGQQVLLQVDESRRILNSRLHSAGHLLDVCMRRIGLDYLEPGKGYHFPDGPFVEYKGKVPENELQTKQKELEVEANALISKGGKVSSLVLPYKEAAEVCGGGLPDYIPKDSTPRIIKLGDSPGCPCGGTHVSDISEIMCIKVTQIRTKKGMTKVFYTLGF